MASPCTYCSTRGGERGLPFERVLLAAYAADGGLFVPEQLPHVSTATLRSWAPTVSFARWAYQSLVINEFPPSRAERIIPSMNDVLLADYGYDGYDKWDGVLPLVLNAFIFRALTYCATKFINFEKR